MDSSIGASQLYQVYAKLLQEINTPEEALTRAEIEREWGVSDRTVLKRLRILDEAGVLGKCQKPGTKINGQPYMVDAYYYLEPESGQELDQTGQ